MTIRHFLQARRPDVFAGPRSGHRCLPKDALRAPLWHERDVVDLQIEVTWRSEEWQADDPFQSEQGLRVERRGRSEALLRERREWHAQAERLREAPAEDLRGHEPEVVVAAHRARAPVLRRCGGG